MSNESQAAKKTSFKYTKYAKIVAAMAHDYSVNPNDLEDLIQETLAQALSGFDEKRGKRFTNFLRMVAQARIVDFIRALGKGLPSLEAREKVIARDKDDALGQAGAGPATMMIREADWSRIERALAGLTEAEREVVSLKYVDGHDYTEIAAKKGISEHDVRIVIERARRELKRKLAFYFSSRISQRMELGVLFDSIDSLPALYKSVFVLKHVEGLAEADVVARLQESESDKVVSSVVRTRLERAYSHIKTKAGEAKWKKIRAMLGI